MFADAAEKPVGVGHFTDEAKFGEIAGGIVFGEIGEEGLVGGGVVAGEQDGLGTETVAEVVAG
jgi:hypothetical protein